MVGDGDLQKVARNAFMAQNWSWVLNGGANVEVLAGRVVSGNEIEATAIFVVHAWRIHETARSHRLEWNHAGQAFLQPIGKPVNRSERSVTCLYEIGSFGGGEICRQGHQTVIKQAVN